MTTIDSTKSRPWFAASTIEPFDIGSWTLLIICHLLDPIERAASIVVGATLRMPSAAILIATGAAYSTAAAMARNFPGGNSAKAGMRYTKAGIVWRKSRMGRTKASTR